MDQTEEKIDRIISLLTDIREAVAPPWWKRLLRSVLALAWKVALIVLLTLVSIWAWNALSGGLTGMLGTSSTGSGGEGLSIEQTIKALEQVQKIKDGGAAKEPAK